MAERRMFSKTVVLSDSFLDMHKNAICLYYTFGMLADDDGFVNSPKSVLRQIKVKERDYKLLVKKNLIIPFDSGVIAITHWKCHNYIQKDRYKPTIFQKEKEMLDVTKEGIYFLKNDDVYIKNEDVYKKSDDVYTMYTENDSMYTQVKVKVKDNNTHTIEKTAFGSFANVFLTDEEHEQLKKKFPRKYNKLIEKFSVGLKTYGYEYDNHFAAILKWEENDKGKGGRKKQSGAESTFNAEEFDGFNGYSVPDLSKKKVEK